MLNLKFPHFLRIIPEWSKFINKLTIILFIIFILVVNVAFEYKSSLQEINYEIMRNPQDLSLHERIAEKYLYINKEVAEREFYIAEELFKGETDQGKNVLGAEISPWQNWQNISEKKEAITHDIKYWSSINLTFPTYKYAFIKLTVLNYELANIEKAKKYLSSALLESPGDKLLLEIANKLGK